METIGKGPSEKDQEEAKRAKTHFLYGLALAAVIVIVIAILRLFPWWALILIGIGGFILGAMVFRPLTKPKSSVSFDNIDGVTKETHEAALEEGNKKLKTLRSSTDKIQDPGIKAKAKGICNLTEKILESIRKDPKDLKPARSFLGYYLDTAMKILQQYNELEGQTAKSKDMEEVIEKLDGTLGTLEQAFQKQLEKLMENDVMDLDTELTVLERTIEMEGFGRSIDTEKEKL
jgi:5-bromo-4-chloroindolyl phosphate hydrolysis protein